jgi:ABC-2 type transport system permease protein
MTALLRAELLKLRSTRAPVGLVATMTGLVAFAVLLHGFGIASENADSTSEQLTMVLGWGELLGALFAALLGAMSFTAEVRHGTIRPTFVVSPWRGRVVWAKVGTTILFGAGFGLVAGGIAAAAGTTALAVRGIELQPTGGDYLLLVGGSAASAALWAAIGVGVGAVLRHQVPALIGLCAWLLFVEGLVVGDVGGVSEVGRFAPGAAGAAVSGQDPDTFLPPAAGLAVLILYAAAAALIGSLATERRDVA